MATDVNAEAGQPAKPKSQKGARPVDAAPAAEGGEPPVLRMKPPKPAKSEKPAAQAGANELDGMLNRAVSQIYESERNYESALGELSSELTSLSSKASAAQGSLDEPAPLQRLEDQASSLNQRVQQTDQALQDEENTDVLHEMERRIAALAADPNTNPTGAAIKPAATNAPIAELSESALDDRFRDVTADLEQSLTKAEPAREIRAAADETRQIAQSVAASPAPGELDAVVERLRGVENFLARADEQHSRIVAIETHLLSLVDQTRDSSSQMEAIASRSAREAAELVQNQSASLDAAERLDAIQSELRALNARAAQMDDRTVDTLEAMHGALKNLTEKVDRGLAPRASAAQGDRSPKGDRPLPPAAPSHADVEITRGAEEPADRNGGGGSGASADPANVGASIPDYQPVPPLPPQAPAQRAASQPANGAPVTDAHLEAAASASDKSLDSNDFIASARRAAEAAARQSAAPAQRESTDNLPRPQPPAAQVDAAMPVAAKKPRSVLVIAAVVLLMVSAALFYKRLNGEGRVTDVDGPAHLVPGDAAPEPSIGSGKTPARIPERDQPGTGGTPPSDNGVTGSLVPPARGGNPGRPPQLNMSGQTKVSPDLAAPTTDEQAGVPYHLTGTKKPPATQFRIVENARPLDVRQTPANPQRSTARSKKVAKLTPAPLPPAEIGPEALRHAAANGDARAQFEVATRFAKGKSVDRDFAAAARWYSRAASQGFAPAQYRLAALYERGRGLKRDIGRARVWYLRAAEAGNVKAMHNLAVIHTKTAGKSPDYATASQWFAKAAEHGLSDSQFNLGILYENGLGVRKDLKTAYKWFLLAAQAGDGEAAKRVGGLALRILPEEKVAIEQAAKGWRAKNAKASANDVPPAAKAWKLAKGSSAAAPKPAAKPDPLTARAQTLLNKLGYDAGTADGLMGPKTRAAITAFQESVGMDQTGRASTNLITQLEMRTG